jgi:hypothetical protein
MLQHLFLCYFLLKALMTDEVVVFSIDLALPHRAGCVADC